MAVDLKAKCECSNFGYLVEHCPTHGPLATEIRKIATKALDEIVQEVGIERSRSSRAFKPIMRALTLAKGISV